MDCKEFRELLDHYELIDELDRECMDAHCELCDECRSEMEFFKSIINVSASIPCPQPPKMLIDEVNAKLDADKTPRFYLSPVAKRSYATVAACLVVGIAIGINGGYIKDRLSDDNNDGVIKETVVVTEPNEDTEPEEEVKAEVEATPEAKPSVKKSEAEERKDVKKPATSENPQKTVKENKAESVALTPTTAPVEVTVVPTVKPDDDTFTIEHGGYRVPEKDATREDVNNEKTSLNDYVPVVEGNQVAMAQYSVGTYGVERSLKVDYIHVSSRDMGAVVSILSEYGVSSSKGQFTTDISNFYQILSRFDAEGIDYDYRLMYTYGNEVSFEVRYHTDN